MVAICVLFAIVAIDLLYIVAIHVLYMCYVFVIYFISLCYIYICVLYVCYIVVICLLYICYIFVIVSIFDIYIYIYIYVYIYIYIYRALVSNLWEWHLFCIQVAPCSFLIRRRMPVPYPHMPSASAPLFRPLHWHVWAWYWHPPTH